MDYIAVTIPCPDTEAAEITMALLSDLPFESFETTETSLRAYITVADMERNRQQIEQVLHGTGTRCIEEVIPARNWNAEWESSFEPVQAGDIYIRAPFHEPAPEGMTDIVIMPKMSFGTGHHATTRLVAGFMEQQEMQGKQVLDMGSGTGVLAIIAARMGATHIDAVDIDEWAYNNCVENIADNKVGHAVTAMQGDVTAVAGRTYDIILANINRNILCRDMEAYAAMLKPGGIVIISGILTTDVHDVDQSATAAGLTRTVTATEEQWAAAKYVK